MSRNTLFSALRNQPPRYRAATPRRLGLLWLLGRRACRRAALRATLFGGWVWFAAGSLIGFEAFEILFGTFALAPELLPLVILGLALTWGVRRQLRRASVRVRRQLRRASVRVRAYRRRDHP
ncbi:hypothetical protein DC347_10260 [Pseudarthrobacter sp. AG30]|uniref:hypothetical protein n=1 Tax=Pseudarthrobacter sp. AG30 TaxID=2249742 RepID=UPI000D6437D4|nr:hypothetical protein [Pseudarthrobacter sp. AG30]RAX16993.1 hypothetical protein DC347_10260 [Pseudarthrobacter sp. AG30]